MLSYNVLNSWVEKMMKKSLPVKIKTSDITNLSTKDINKLKAGDIVLKKTGNQKHAYIVSYKEDNQGICLTYNDALYTETVSYDYNTTTKTWDYNSTDKTEFQNKLIAGDNIEINGNVISGHASTYTAGNGISINEGVISVSSHIYKHIVECTHSSYTGKMIIEIINNSNTPIDMAWLENANNEPHNVYGMWKGNDGTTFYIGTLIGFAHNTSALVIYAYGRNSNNEYVDTWLTFSQQYVTVTDNIITLL